MSLLIATVYKQKDGLFMLDRNINFSVLHEEIAEDKTKIYIVVCLPV